MNTKGNAMLCRVDDRDAGAENWTNTNGNTFRILLKCWRGELSPLTRTKEGLQDMGACQSGQSLSDHYDYFYYVCYYYYIHYFWLQCIGMTSCRAHISGLRGPAWGFGVPRLPGNQAWGRWKVGQVPLSVLLNLNKLARFLNEFHDFQYVCLDLPPLAQSNATVICSDSEYYAQSDFKWSGT